MEDIPIYCIVYVKGCGRNDGQNGRYQIQDIAKSQQKNSSYGKCEKNPVFRIWHSPRETKAIQAKNKQAKKHNE